MIFPFLRQQFSALVFCCVVALDLRVVVLIPFDPVVDMQIDRTDHPKAFVLILDLYFFRFGSVVKQLDAFSD